MNFKILKHTFHYANPPIFLICGSIILFALYFLTSNIAILFWCLAFLFASFCHLLYTIIFSLTKLPIFLKNSFGLNDWLHRDLTEDELSRVFSHNNTINNCLNNGRNKNDK